MDVRTLQYFLAVARERSISRAAQSLHITQPPLSRQLKDLEEELGTKLFVRGARNVTLTEDGILLRRRAEEIVELMERTRAELAGPGDVRGEVSICAGQSRGVSILARTAARLQAIHPHVRYRLYSGDAEIVKERLKNGTADFGLFVGSIDFSPYETIRLPVNDTWGVLIRKDNPLAARSCVHPEDLLDKPLFLSHQAFSGGDLSAWFGRDPNTLNVILTSDLIYNASLFVTEGMGCAITLDGLMDTSIESELRFRPLKPSISADLTVAWKKHQPLSEASREFLQLLKIECAAPAQSTMPST